MEFRPQMWELLPVRVPFVTVLVTQSVQLECHYGIRAHKTIHGMVFGTYLDPLGTDGLQVGPTFQAS